MFQFVELILTVLRVFVFKFHELVICLLCKILVLKSHFSKLRLCKVLLKYSTEVKVWMYSFCIYETIMKVI